MDSKPYIHFGTFDAERYWRPDNAVSLPAIADRQGQRIIAQMDQLLAIACRPDDILMARTAFSPALRAALAAANIRFCERPLPSSPAQQAERILLDQVPSPSAAYALAPYAVTDAVSALRHRWQVTSPLPDAGNVARLSSKLWSNQWVRSHQLPGECEVVTQVAQLRRYAIDHAGAGFILKDPYGVAGRGAIHITSSSVLESVCRHLEKQVSVGSELALLAQPFFPRRTDFSAHLRISESGNIEWLGWRQMQNNGLAYNGSGALAPALITRLATEGYQELACELARDMAQQGYFGPLCIDAMLLADDRIIPLLEVNPRVSMGLLSLLLEKKFAPEFAVDMCVWSVKITAADVIDRLLQQLDQQAMLARQDRPGILPLTTATALPPRGRLYFARVCPRERPDAAAGYEARLLQTLEAIGGAR
ncbi:hypothetical protein [Lonsdalea populi]|uniref:hypothetical protein n=1 Tax=Lonsdalea populi TaxID=1172565 RepID=UPI000A229236|nr:hypothetical protein [Lonsdalea populi]OSM94522.1 hypothetical protein AU508_13620 [Lonsdalea populi]RAT68838.1 hypothetical protein AU504_12085 [Lonsdalea populi]RAT71722.1 hypothetical protein AU505_08415 [Lonsdalea populi]RAT76443.1 hypothetical protein AU506_05915 [Lonsdalea populi]RAT77490.1 hypothetical protein AU507_11770 [Lonsdalea populi]